VVVTVAPSPDSLADCPVAYDEHATVPAARSLLERIARGGDPSGVVFALAQAFDAISDAAYLLAVEPGPRFRIAAINHACARLIHTQASEALGRYVDGENAGAFASVQQYREAIRARRPARYTRRVDGPRGRLELEVTVFPIVAETHEVSHVLCVTRDITEVTVTRERIDHSERLGRAVIDSLRTPLAVIDRNGALVARNAAWIAVAKTHPSGVWRAGIGEALVPPNLDETKDDLKHERVLGAGIQSVLGASTASYVCDYFAAGDPPSWWRAHIMPLAINEGGAVLSFTDITDSKTAEAELSHAATHDVLTGLPNRELFYRQLELALLTPDRSVAVAFIDVDEFKTVNDHFGHEVGDQLLMQIAERLKRVVRGCDTIARYAGDEFVILLNGFKGEEKLVECGARIVDAFSRPFALAECVLSVGVSVGLATGHSGASEASVIVRRADEAMYRAKNAGKNRYVINHR
jgi:diguanylate cyclase (GGDEF)-like protein